jgi:hypothetical protein
MMFVGATALRARVLEAMELVGVTVLGGARCSVVNPESLGNMGSRNMIGIGRCEKSSSNCIYILRPFTFLTVIACGGFFLIYCGRRFFYVMRSG